MGEPQQSEASGGERAQRARGSQPARGARSAYLALLVAVSACSQGGGSARPKGEDSGGVPVPDDLDPRCARVQPRVHALYEKAPGPAGDKDKDMDKALAADLLAANVTMVMNDCRADPDRVAACAERAADAAELERTCLIPLDDEGAVDGDRLRSTGK